MVGLQCEFDLYVLKSCDTVLEMPRAINMYRIRNVQLLISVTRFLFITFHVSLKAVIQKETIFIRLYLYIMTHH